MGFDERKTMGEVVANAIGELFRQLNFEMVNFGYENTFSDNVRQKIRRLYSDPTVSFVRFMPDKFAYYNENNIFLIEVKVCNTPIVYDSRVEKLKQLSGDQTLSKSNIGAVETSAIENYVKLGSIGVKILLVIFSTFHQRPIVAEWVDNIKIVHQDKVIYGQGNASRTPYSNINLDNLRSIQELLISEVNLDRENLYKEYQSCLDSITGSLNG